MKRLLYIAFNDIENQLYGVHAKMLSQCRAFGAYGYQVDMIQRKGPATVLLNDCAQPIPLRSRSALLHNHNIRALLDKKNQISDIKAYLKGCHYDACYIRYDFSDPGFISLLKSIKKICPKIALELPTYPYEAENRARLISRLKLAVDKQYRSKLKQYVDFIVTFYGGYEKIFDIPVVVIPNGFDFSTMSLVSRELPKDGLHIIAVSSMREWHGYERFIEGMRNYYQNDGNENIILHLVGNGREYAKYESLIHDYSLEDHVILEGAMHGEKLDALYEICALGIDSLARHRSGISVLSSLKSREYGAKGIPMINSCEIDIIDKTFPYMLQVRADESPINMEDVLNFYHNCFPRGKSRIAIGEEIRTYVENRSGMKQTLSAVAERLMA